MSKQNNILEKYFSLPCLKLSWERMIRSNGKDVKDYFGIEIFSANLENNLSRLSELIIKGDYKPSRPFKYYEPKASKTHRTKTVLSIEDSLVYQSIANIVATNNYLKLSENNRFVFGSVLHPEVVQGIDLLNDPNADFYFFEYYIPLYNKFINSVNTEIENTNIKFKLETDITGFFDAIPHSKLLMELHKFGVEPEILNLFSDCLNIFSGTKDSITPGVGIPQGNAASFFYANLFLTELDHLISQNGYTYYRYMDDIRIYEDSEEKLTEALVLIDNYLKGKALSLNTKKTSIEEIKDRQAEKQTLLNSSLDDAEIEIVNNDNDLSISVTEQSPDNEQSNLFIVKTLSGGELLDYCRKEIKDVEELLLSKFKDLDKNEFNPRTFLSEDEKIKKEIIQIAYRWRSANSILKKISEPILNPSLIPIWLFCVEHFFWKANHFCWNLNQYGPHKPIMQALNQILLRFHNYEWVRYQILSNMALVQSYNATELKEIFRKAKDEKSSLVRLGYYMILLRHLNKDQQLYTSFSQAIKSDNEPYIKKHLAAQLAKHSTVQNYEQISFWFGL